MKIESRISGFARAAHLCRRHASAVLWVAMAALFPSACSDDVQQPTPQTDGHTAVIYLNFKTGGAPRQTVETDASESPETRAPMTRAAVDEDAINTVDVLSFKADPSAPNNIKKGTFFYRAQGTYDASTQTVRVRLLGASERQTLVVLANVREQVNALGAAYGEQKEAVMNRLTFDAGADAAPDFTNGMPMWGELPNQEVDENFSPLGTPKEVTMIRAAAKFTLINPAQADPKGFFYYYDDLRLYNYRAKGRIAPDNYNAADKKADTPTVPAGARPGRGTYVGLDSEVSPPVPGAIGIFNGLKKTFYLCEVDNKNRPSGGNALDDLCLIMHVKPYLISPKPEVDGYYRLDFKDYASGAPMDILRNHEYRIRVESVDGLPAPTPEQAFNGNHTLKCRIVPWNEVHEEVKVPSNKRLKVDRRIFTFDGDIQIGVASLPVNITSENTQWTITGKPSWISLSQTSGTAGVPATVTISANSKNFTQNTRNAVLSIRTGAAANELEYRLHVSQQPACGFGNSMKLMRIGGSSYQTTRMGNGGVCWMIDASREGGPNMAARPRTYPFTAATIGPIYWGSIPHRACPDGWRLPTAWEVINLIRSTTGSYPAVFTRLTESGAGIASGNPPSFSLPTGYYESVLAIWTQTPMRYSSPQRVSPASVLQTGIFWEWKPGSHTETVPKYRNRNIWALVHAAGNDIHDPAGLPAGFHEYGGIHYLNGGSVRCVHDQ